MKGYSSLGAVAAIIQQDITAAQMNRVLALLASAEAVVDAVTDGAWLTGPRVLERYRPAGAVLYLRSRPVVSVEQVQATYANGTGHITLQVGPTGYIIDDLAEGILYLPLIPVYDRILVSYTPAGGVPAAIAEATAQLAAAQFADELGGVPGDVKAYRIFNQVQIQNYDQNVDSLDARVPPSIAALLRPYRRMSALVA